MKLIPSLILVGAAILAPVTQLHAQKPLDFSDAVAVKRVFDAWNAPCKPFRIVDHIYYVGAAGISSFLITTPEGHILLDTGFEETVPLIRQHMTALGFRIEDIKFILSSHAHIDHIGGHALMKELSGAKIVMSAADGDLLASGGRDDFLFSKSKVMQFKPAQVDRKVREGDVVELGGTRLVCHLTPGHTKGCTTWTMDATEDGKVYHVVFFGSTSINPGTKLVNTPGYPTLAEDLADSYRRLKEIPCDIFLAPHATFFGMAEKARRLEAGEKPNPFIDRDAFRRHLDGAEKTFLKQWNEERQAR